MTIFVFGSNLCGIHGAGAALFARKYRGAVWGVGEGHRGSSYALPTKRTPRMRLSLPEIAHHVGVFNHYTQSAQHLTFEVTPVGTGLAGYREDEIRALFEEYSWGPHVAFTDTWERPPYDTPTSD